jgi:hypothetical protein
MMDQIMQLGGGGDSPNFERSRIQSDNEFNVVLPNSKQQSLVFKDQKLNNNNLQQAVMRKSKMITADELKQMNQIEGKSQIKKV